MPGHRGTVEPEDADDSSSTDLSLGQATTGGGGKARLDSLRENLFKQQERLTALRERALRKSEDGAGAPLKSSLSDSMESLKSLGQKLTMLKGSPGQQLLSSTPLVTPTKLADQLEYSGSEKLQMLNQRTEQNRALLEQRKRDMAKSLQSVKTGLRLSTSSELGSSMSDLRAAAAAAAAATPAPVSRHRSAADLQQQQQQAQAQPASEEGRLKLLKNKMKLIEMKQGRKEQELQQELHELRHELAQREQHIQQLEASERPLAEQENTRLHAEIEQLRTRNAELEHSSEMLETLRLELHSAREQLLEQQQSQAVSTDAQVNVELAKQLQELQQQLLEQQQQQQLEELDEPSAGSETQRLAELEAIIETQNEQLAEKTTELNVLNVNLRVLEERLAQSVKSKPLFQDEEAAASEQLQLQQLKQKLDECNKSNIKLKLKCKQAEKQLQQLQGQDAQQELLRLTAENEQLQQRITVLEDEKGQWQLAHVEREQQVEEDQQQQHQHQQQLVSKSTATAGQNDETIRLLEEQKEELQQALAALQMGSAAARVESELSEVQLEEQLSQRVQQLEAEANEQRQQLQTLQSEKEALDKKLSHYINENMELLDKLEKLSSSSSAESIEIVERPTDRRFSPADPAAVGDGDGAGAGVDPNVGAGQEPAAAPVRLPSFVSELTQTDLVAAGPELEVNESLAQLRNESDELLQKIELFTSERREVLAKMEQLQAQNAQLQVQLQTTQEQLLAERGSLQAQLEELQRDKQQLSLQLSDKSSNLSQELSSMQRSSEVVAALDCGSGGAALFDKCERSLSKLSSELDAYRKANDRNAKLNVSKKLAKEAKNVHSQLSELLHKVKEASTAVETVTVVETVVAVTAPNGKALAEYEQLNAQNAELKAALAALQAELDEMRDSCESTSEQLSKRAIGHKLDEEWEREQEQEREKEREQEREKERERERESLIAEQQQQLAQLESIIAELRAGETEHLQLIGSQSAELVQLQLQAEQYDQTLNNSEMAHEKHMEQQQRLRRELQSRIETLEGEQSILQALVAEQKQQLIESYSEGEYETQLKLLELQQCQQELEQSESRNKELRDKLKKYALNLKKRQVELQQEQANSAELRDQKQRLQAELEQAQQQAQLENKELQQQLLKQQPKLAKLKEEVERLQVELQNTVHANTALRQESYQLELSLAEQTSSEELRRQLEQKSLKFDKSKEVIKQRNATIQNLQRELAELRVQLQAQSEDEELKHSMMLLQVQQLQAQSDQLREDKINFEMAYARLETLHSGIQLKLQQDQSYIESVEAQNAELQTKCTALEDRAAVLQGHELSGKEELQLLEQQLQMVEQQRAENEAHLAARLQQLAERELSQSEQLQRLASEAQEAREQMLALQAAHDALLARHKQLTQQAQLAQEERDQELHELRTQLEQRNQELQRQRQVYDAKLAAKASELDELDCDLSAHMERATAQTRELTHQLERAQEQLQQRDEQLARLNEELAELERERLQLLDSSQRNVQQMQQLRMQSNQQLRALQQQIADLGTHNQTDDQVHIETETNRLAEKLAQLDEQAEQLALAPAPVPADDWMAWSIPDPDPGQVPVSAEQSLPLPAPAMFFGGDAAAAPSPFDEIVAQPLQMSTQNVGVAQGESSDRSIENLQRNVSDLEKHAKELESQLVARNQALAEHEEQRVQLERLLAEREQELDQLRAAAEERERLAAIEQLIQPPTLDMFFGGSGGGVGETVPDAAVARSQQELGLPQSEPVVEQLITPKKAYLCQPEQQQQEQQQQLELAIDWAVDVDEDPWANAGAEQQEQEQQLTDVNAALHARIEELEAQKAKLQTKTAKLMKCVKEYRSKEQQEAARKDNNNELDGAIMDELKLQLQLQETRQAKTEELLQQQTLEKEKLVKRIDVLTAGNERMAELKERQDREVQMYQTRIRELQQKLEQLESWDEVTATPTPIADDAADAADAARATIENLQAENQELNSECQELLAQLQQEKQRAQREREQLQAQLEEAHDQQAEQLKQQVEQLKQQAEQQVEQQVEQVKHQVELEKQQVKQEKQQAELEKLQAEQECQQLQLQLAELRAKQLELPAMVTTPPAATATAASDDESRALLQEKESEIVHLKQRIEDLMREDQTEKLVLEILTKNQELQLLRIQVKQLEEDKLEQQQQASQAAAQPAEELEQLRRQCEQQQQEKSDMEEELRVLNNHVLASLELEDKMKQALLELDTKTIEITELRKTLEQLQQQQAEQQVEQQAEPQSDIGALNKQWEALVEQKCSEVASIWQEHLAQREADYQAKIEQLTADAAQSPAEKAEEPTDVDEMLVKMQRALETQEMEIVTLKEQLAIRSAEYARLASQYDPFRLQNTLGGGGNPSGSTAAGNSSDPQSAELVPKSDLDYALMMLHQRDMRVEEMIVELVQLLEERDHLQLKLSDTLRQLEAERTGAPSSISPAAPTTTAAAALGSPNLQLSVRSSSSSGDLAVSPAASGSDLKQKLAELQTVKHSKDKAIVDEREQRLQQMVQLQRDMAKAAPTAGAAAAGTSPVTTALPSPTPPAQQPQQQLDVDPSQPALRSPSMLLMDWILGNNKSEDEAPQTPHSLSSPQQQQQQQPSSSSSSHPPASN
ncbi:protein lava lamp [Drosophila montana]|uniref:protein lava lamp n=1 Tax=Drosophila montana TaxID=40370 RepID=UPI00313BFD8A